MSLTSAQRCAYVSGSRAKSLFEVYGMLTPTRSDVSHIRYLLLFSGTCCPRKDVQQLNFREFSENESILNSIRRFISPKYLFS